MSAPKDVLHRYLQTARDVLVWKLDGLDDHDVRRPLVASGTNLLGLVKHLTALEVIYFGETFGRPLPDRPGWMAEMDDDPYVDLVVAADESRADTVALYVRACAHSDAVIAATDLDTTGTVAHWPAQSRTVPLHLVLAHMIAETTRHAGHADILRETVDGTIGHLRESSNLPADAIPGAAYARVQAAADAAARR